MVQLRADAGGCGSLQLCHVLVIPNWPHPCAPHGSCLVTHSHTHTHTPRPALGVEMGQPWLGVSPKAGDIPEGECYLQARVGTGPHPLPTLGWALGGTTGHAQDLPPHQPVPPASPDLFAAVEPILPSLQKDNIVVWVLGSGPYPPGVVALQELLDAASEELEPEDVWQPEDMNDTCLYIFTSGTTGGCVGPA